MLHRSRVIFSFTLGMALLAIGSAFSGCVFWHNFSTYYNTLYLAQTHLDAYEAHERAIVAQSPNGAIAILNHRWFDEEYHMRQVGMRAGHVDPITPSFSQSLSATKQITNPHLDSAIIFGSKVLADKKANKYKEDALFIVGKAQFYKNDFIGAERKFRELLANYPQTKYGAQVQVFLARSMLVNRDVDTATMTLERGLAANADSKDVATISSIHRAMAELIYAKNPDSLSAIASELHKAEAGLSGEELARLAYQEGAVEFLNGDWPSAESAFQTSYQSASDDWLAGEAHVAHALALREEGNLDAAKTELTSVVKLVKYGASGTPARYELAYTDELIARKAVQNDLRSTTAFRDTYEQPVMHEYYILDTTYKNSSALMISRAKFRQAEILREMGRYDTASRLASPLIGTKDFSSTAMNEYVSDHANSLVSYAEWRKELTHIDTLEASLKQGTAVRVHSNVKVQGETPNEDYHLKAMQEVLGPRWSPQNPVQMSKMDSDRVKETEARLKKNAPAKLMVADTTHFIDSLYFRAGTAHYQLGRAYETFGEIPEARQEYQMADTMNIGPMDTGRTALRARTLYAWLELEKQEKNQVVADSLLHELLSRYGQTMYAEQARILYVTSSRNSPGELAYLDAYKLLRASGLDAAKPQMLNIVSTFSQEDVAPRSLYALAVTYEEDTHYDSAFAYYNRVLKEYPYSSYALAIRPRLAEVGTTPALAHPPTRSLRSTTINQDTAASADQQSATQQTPGTQQNQSNNPQRPFTPPPLGQPPPLPPGIKQPPMPPNFRMPQPPPPPVPPDPGTSH